MTPHAFANHKLQRFTIGARPRASDDLLLGVLLEAAAWCVYGISAVLLLVLLLASVGSLILYALVWLLVAAGTRLRRRAKRYRLDVRAKLLNDRRDPVLYLRPFDDDRVENPERDDKKTYEELLASVLDDAGPVVAVGKPGEALPLLGATRLYFKDAEWQANVVYLMSVSRLVVIQADVTQGVEWEWETATRNLSHDRLLVSFLSWRAYDEDARRSLYDRFRRRAEKAAPCSMPDELDDADFMYFETGWEGRRAEAGRWKRFFFRLIELGAFRNRGLSVTRIRESLRPVLKKRGLKLGVGRTLFDLLKLFATVAVLAWLVYGQYAEGADGKTLEALGFLAAGVVGHIWFKKRQAQDATITLNLR